MDILAILGTFKDKTLDLKDVELLRHAYELQEENIRQLQTNNESFKETSSLLREKNQALENQVSSLKKENAMLRESLDALQKSAAKQDTSDLSDEHVALLQQVAAHNGGEGIVKDQLLSDFRKARPAELTEAKINLLLRQLETKELLTIADCGSYAGTIVSLLPLGFVVLERRGLI